MRKAGLLGIVFASVFLAGPVLAQQEDEDPDLPPGTAGKIDKLSFMRAREEQIDLMRGVPHFLDYEPRSAAIAAMKAQERTKLLIDPSFWTQIGPAPIP